MIKHVVNPTSKDKCLDKERNVLIDKGGSFTRTNAGNYSVLRPDSMAFCVRVTFSINLNIS